MRSIRLTAIAVAALVAATPGAAWGQAAAPAQNEASAADAERLALARTMVAGLLPPGSYGRMMTEVMGGSMDAAMGGMLDMTAEDLGAPAGGKDSKTRLRDRMREEDPHFEERMRIMSRVMGEEMGRLGATIEPALRDGLTKAAARRFTTAQLREINGFFATDGGKALAGNLLLIWADPEMMKAMMSAMPAMMKEMPAMMKRVEEATKHLPPPPKKSPPEQSEDEDEEA